MVTFIADATKDGFNAYALPGPRHYTPRTRNDCLAEASEVADRFPKYLRVTPSHTSGMECSDDADFEDFDDADFSAAGFTFVSGINGRPGRWVRTYRQAWVGIKVILTSDGVNGGRNETGIKRLRAFRRICDTLGYDIEWQVPASNSLTQDEFEALLDA